MRASRISRHERVTVKPSVGCYNLFNFANFDLPMSIMSGFLTGTAGTINGTDPAAHNTNRVGVGTGVFTLGSPREIEFGLKIAFWRFGGCLEQNLVPDRARITKKIDAFMRLIRAIDRQVRRRRKESGPSRTLTTLARFGFSCLIFAATHFVSKSVEMLSVFQIRASSNRARSFFSAAAYASLPSKSRNGGFRSSVNWTIA